MKNKEKISAIYRNHVTRIVNSLDPSDNTGSLRPDETDDVWEEICARLDIEEVWVKISAGLKTVVPPSHGPGFFHKCSAALLLILAVIVNFEKPGPDDTPQGPETAAFISNSDPRSGLTGQNIGENRPVTTGFPGYITASVQKTVKEAETREKLIRIENKDKIRSAGMSEEKPGKGQVAVSALPDRQSEKPLPVTLAATNDTSGESTIPFSNTPEVRKLTIPSYSSGLRGLETSESLYSIPQCIYSSKFTGGFITSFRNTWLLNRETLDGLRSESLSTTEIVVFPDAGLSFNYLLNKRLSLQADAFLYSGTGQGYQEYIFGRYSRKKIVLRYSTIVLSVKYTTADGGNISDRSSINLSAGGYISFLHNADQRINTDIRKVSSCYRKIDFGTRLSGELELHLSKYFSVAPGLNLTFGLTNIYKGTDQIPGYMRRTHNASAGLQLSFYRILK